MHKLYNVYIRYNYLKRKINDRRIRNEEMGKKNFDCSYNIGGTVYKCSAFTDAFGF